MASTLSRDYDIARIIDNYERRISFLERRLTGLFGSATPPDVATQACRVTRSSAFSAANGTTVDIPFNAEIFDNNVMHSNVTNPERITFNEPGYYAFGANIEMQIGNDYLRINLQIRKTGGDHIAFVQHAPIGSNVAQRAFLSGVDHFEEGDYIVLRLFQQNSGGAARNVEVSPEYSPVFYAAKIGV